MVSFLRDWFNRVYERSYTNDYGRVDLSYDVETKNFILSTSFTVDKQIYSLDHIEQAIISYDGFVSFLENKSIAIGKL